MGGDKVAELDKVIKGIECHRSGICDNDKTLCPYWNEESDCSKKMLADTLELINDMRQQIIMLVSAQHTMCELMKNKEIKE